MTDLDEVIRYPYAILIGKFRYLVTYCQEIVVDPEGSQADRIQLYFGRFSGLVRYGQYIVWCLP